MSRTEKALKMVLGSIMNQAMIVIAGLILPPLIIKNYGSATNGLVNSVKQILNYFSVVSVGLGAAGQVALYKPLARKDNQKINLIMSELTSFFDKMSYIFAILIGIFAFILPIIRSNEIDGKVVFLVVLICGAGSFIEFKYLQKYKILLSADQKQYISSQVNTEGIFINLICSIILIYMKAPIVIVQLMATIAYLIRILLMTKKIKKIYPDLDLKIKTKDKQIKNQKKALLFKTSDIIINYAPMTIVTILFSFSNVSVYSIYNTIFMSIGMIVNIFSSGFSSSFGNLLAENNDERLKECFMGYSFAFRTLANWLYCCAAILIVPFVSVYIKNTDGINYLIPTLGICFALNGLFKLIRTPALTVVDSLGKYTKKNIILNYVEVFSNIIISILASIKLGIEGVLIGGIIASLFRSVMYIIDIYKENVKLSITKEFILLFINIIMSIVLYTVFDGIRVYNYFDWIGNAIIVAFVSGISIFLINFLLDYTSFKELYKRFNTIIKKGRN